jgi:hypothetical protein
MTGPDSPPVDFASVERPVDLDVDLIVRRGYRRRRAVPAVAGSAVVVLALLAAGLVVGLSSRHDTTTATSGRTGTRVIDFSPFTAAGTVKPGIRVTRVEHGTCAHHKDDPRADMFDCTVTGNDGSADESGPCFYGTHAAGLLCPGLKMTSGFEVVPDASFTPPPTGSLPAKSPTPYDLELSNGQSCFPFSIHDSTINGVAVTYVCATPKTSPLNYAVLYGPINRTSRTWTVQYRARLRGSATLRTLSVNIAYY